MGRIDSAVSDSHELASQLCGLADEQAQAERLDALAAGLEQDVARFRF